MFIIAGTAYGSLDNPKLTFSQGVNLRAGINKISLLSIAVGLPVRFLSLSLSHAHTHTAASCSMNAVYVIINLICA